MDPLDAHSGLPHKLGSGLPHTLGKTKATPLFGVKDILLLKIVNRKLEVLNNECELTFYDHVKITCKLTLDEIFDIYKHNAFKGYLRDESSSLESYINEWYREKRNIISYKDAKIYDAAQMDAMTDKWIDLYHKKAINATRQTEIVAVSLSKQKEAFRKNSLAKNIEAAIKRQKSSFLI